MIKKKMDTVKFSGRFAIEPVELVEVIGEVAVAVVHHRVIEFPRGARYGYFLVGFGSLHFELIRPKQSQVPLRPRAAVL